MGGKIWDYRRAEIFEAIWIKCTVKGPYRHKQVISFISQNEVALNLPTLRQHHKLIKDIYFYLMPRTWSIWRVLKKFLKIKMCNMMREMTLEPFSCVIP